MNSVEQLKIDVDHYTTENHHYDIFSPFCTNSEIAQLQNAYSIHSNENNVMAV